MVSPLYLLGRVIAGEKAKRTEARGYGDGGKRAPTDVREHRFHRTVIQARADCA